MGTDTPRQPVVCGSVSITIADMFKRVLIALFLFLLFIACSTLFVLGLGIYASYCFDRDERRDAALAQSAIHTSPAATHYTVVDLKTLGGSYDYHGGGVNDVGDYCPPIIPGGDGTWVDDFECQAATTPSKANDFLGTGGMCEE